jgi:RimJ/RimL family protein N-acetyltransferase
VSDPSHRLRLVGVAHVPVEVEPPWALRTLRMTLRWAIPSDRDAFLKAVARSRAGIDRHCPLHRQGEDDEALFGRLLLRHGGDGPGHTSLRCLGFLDGGRLAGGFNLIVPTAGLERKATMNWWIAEGLSGRGLATEGAAALLRHALTDSPPNGDGLGLHFVEAWITRDNAASVRIAEKVGFTRSPERESYLRTGDRWVLHDLYLRRVDDPC